MSDEYNGWTNRETWCLNMWLTNEQEIYQETLRAIGDGTIGEATDLLKNYVENDLKELSDENPELRKLFEDVGSLWRVNWQEIAKGLRET